MAIIYDNKFIGISHAEKDESGLDSVGRLINIDSIKQLN